MKHDFYDITILGCGPAGLSAAINATIRNKKVLVIGAEICSPPLHKAQKINNYLGIPGVRGEELLACFMEHALQMGTEIINSKAEAINEAEGVYSILVKGELLKSKAIVIATGIPYKPTIPREEDMLGRGLGYCATCDGPIYRGKDVLLIAYSGEAENEANFMAEICRKVYYLPLYQGTMELDSRVEIINGKPGEIIGSDFVQGLKLKNGSEIIVEGLFILGGETAPDRLIPGLEIVDKHIKVNRQQETNLPGVFAAGDCTGPPYQVAKSVGEGQVAGLNASKYAGRK
ncbi:MAG: NAD(P)/FAD-dependent oxidoreductase [Syntrophomonas sp.]|uniref:NAD(P)/FAD-dependent oxidoreductase n=1 Tax=Syntrophomonas sp. TaxID=2053627 RepID=UPI00260CE90D|nr:NAD(P)/FAD-dependent oxidoreductase [Syntrophomonas sp.]MDD2511468.1 NAD(P)/FAD-dependent oxidoreductase [Syntrophomonas sp.]MDD4627240.1 NAD(P)/FAD-dependent oxidoreductase [Syntrophomonas sp.]